MKEKDGKRWSVTYWPKHHYRSVHRYHQKQAYEFQGSRSSCHGKHARIVMFVAVLLVSCFSAIQVSKVSDK